jgi:hypothetical protein
MKADRNIVPLYEIRPLLNHVLNRRLEDRRLEP